MLALKDDLFGLLEYNICTFSYTKVCLRYTVMSAKHRKCVVVSSKITHNYKGALQLCVRYL
jgi:hypothetical protein